MGMTTMTGEQVRQRAIRVLMADEAVSGVVIDPTEDPDDWFFTLYIHYAGGAVIGALGFVDELRAAPLDEWETVLAHTSTEVVPNGDGTYRMPDDYYKYVPETRECVA